MMLRVSVTFTTVVVGGGGRAVQREGGKYEEEEYGRDDKDSEAQVHNE